MSISTILDNINNYIWGFGLIYLLLFVGIIYTIKLKFVQFRFIPYILKSIHKNKHSESQNISQLKTVCLSLGTAMGTGNITGVASAIAIGGAGAIFWMWISAFFGMALVYSENYLAILFRKNNDCSGPMAYLKYGLGSNILPIIFAVFCIFAAFGMGGMVQVSSFSENLYNCYDFNPLLLSAIIFAVIYFVIKGGIGRIGSAAQALLPLITIIYLTVSFLVIFKFRSNIPSAFANIFSDAFSAAPIAGGIGGFTISRAVSSGIRRGIFSNEAGLGSSPILHCSSEKNAPSLQGMWSIFEVFFDTIVCCTITALVLLTASSGGEYSITHAFANIFYSKTDLFLAITMAVFAFCTIIGWYYCGETAFSFIFGNSRKNIFCFAFALISASGAIFTLKTVWTLSDIFNGLMAFPNLIGLLLLIKNVKRE